MLFNEKELNELRLILDIYKKLKYLIILAEETDPEKKIRIGLFDEIRHSYDHLMRVLNEKLNPVENVPNQDYIKEDLNSTALHLFRSSFDVLDWLNIIYYKKIIILLSKFHIETIERVVPEYYSKYSLEIEKIQEAVAKIRLDKGEKYNLVKKIEIFENYQEKVETLKEIYLKLLEYEKYLIKFEEIRKKKRLFSPNRIITVISLITSIVMIIFSIFFAIS